MSDEIFVFSDIHGCCREFHILLKRIPLTPKSQIVFLGDYIDRGEDSKGVVDTVLALSKKFNVVTLMGNHEQMFLDFLNDRYTEEAGSFIYNGGVATLSSYSKGKSDYYIPDSHHRFYQNLKLYHETKDYLFVHAGIPNVAIKNLGNVANFNDFLWARESFFESDFPWEKMIIHGHSPIETATFYSKRINIDTGCVYGHRLTALQLPQKITYAVNKHHPSDKTLDRLDNKAERISTRFLGVLPVQIYYKGKTHDFKTANYNEHGMLIYTDDLVEFNLKLAEEVSGIIGQDELRKINFDGAVIRCPN